nr:hypothetical protein Iba_chr08dCG12470 [Ipomoea batatas]
MKAKLFYLFFILLFIVSPLTCARKLSSKPQGNMAANGGGRVYKGPLKKGPLCNSKKFGNCINGKPPRKYDPYSRNCHGTTEP